MQHALTFAVQRGDRRHELLARQLTDDGHHAVLVGDLSEAAVMDALPPGSVAVAPLLSDSMRAALLSRDVRWVEYRRDPACVHALAVMTAENAVQLAMENLELCLSDTASLIIGNGRIGSALAAMLRGLGCQTAVAARRPEVRVAICAAGHRAVDMQALDDALPGLDLIFNTAPAMVLPRERLARLTPQALIIDLASRPGGVDFAAAQALGHRAIHALALPGRLTPQSAARAIGQAVYRAIDKEETP